MADLSVIKQYLVKLGWTSDDGQYAKVQGTLKELTSSITQHTTGATKRFVEMGAAIVGVYAAIGTSAVELMENVAKSDLGFQLYAMRMYMSVDAAKRLKMATDALGYSLNEIAWNDELRGRFTELVKMQKGMQEGLGSNFEGNMKGIRDIGFEFTKLKMEMKYLSQGVASALFEGMGGKGLIEKLKEWNAWIREHLPEIRDKIAQYLIPILKDTWAIFKDIFHIVGQVAGIFLRFIEVLTGSDKMKAATSDFEKFAIVVMALSHGIRAVADAIDWLITSLEKIINNGLMKPLIWLSQHQSYLTDNMEPILEKGNTPPKVTDAKGFKSFIDFFKSSKKMPTDAQLGQLSAGGIPANFEWSPLIQHLFGKDAGTMVKVMQAESGGRNIRGEQNKDGSYDYGLFQINAKIWMKQLQEAGIVENIKDLLDPIKNIAAAKFVFQHQGLSAWKASESRWAHTSHNTGSVHVGQITIQVPKDADPKQYKKAVVEAMREHMNTKVLNNLGEFGGSFQ